MRRLKVWSLFTLLLAVAPAVGCDWRDVEKDKENLPVLSVSAPDKFGSKDDFGKITLPITSDTDAAASQLLVSSSNTTALALIALDASGKATTTNIDSPIFNVAGGPNGYAFNAMAQIPGSKPVRVLLGAAKLKNGLSGVYTVSLGGANEGKVIVATLTPDADPYIGLGVAAGNLGVGDPDKPEYVAASADVLRVYVDESTTAMWSWSDADNGPACPLSIPMPPGTSNDARAVPNSRSVLIGHFWGAGTDQQVAIANFGQVGKGSLSFFSITATGLACLGTITGTEAGFGTAVSTGDFNGDLISDLIVGAPPHGAYVFLGPLDATSTGIALASSDPAVSDQFGASVASFNLDGTGGDDALVGDPGATVSGTGSAGAVQIFSFDGTGMAVTAKKGRLLAAHDPSTNAAYGISVAGLPFCGTCATGARPRLPAIGASTRVLTYFTLGTDLRKP